MEKYKFIILKAFIIVVLIIFISILAPKENAYIPDYETGLPQNTYYTEEEYGYETQYINEFLDNFLNNLYNKDFESIYDVLSEDLKNTKYTDANKFMEYIETEYETILNEESIDNIYTVELDYITQDGVTNIDYFINSEKNNKEEIPGFKITIIEKGPYDLKIKM